MTRKKKLPVGIESFEEIRTEGFYYVDKTGMIRDLLDRWGKVNLFTRPRRFGKSLNMSMLKSFFEIGAKKELFDGLEIAGETDLCGAYMGKFPVVSISLKGICAGDFQTARNLAVKVINEEARRMQLLQESSRLSSEDKELHLALMAREMDDETLIFSIRELSELLYKHYGKKTIILIDEYDVPLAKANEQGYYDEMVLLIRSMFEQALKTNEALYFAVLTGCLRVAKESIFTGLNNPKVFSVSTVRFDEYFGFTDREVREMLGYYGLKEKYGDIKEWYDGYRFGNVDVYCPWDVISYCDELLDDPELLPRDYWSNTSGNEAVRHFIGQMGNGPTKSEIEALTAGETVEKEIREDLTDSRLYESSDNLWSVLFATGYLTRRGTVERNRYALAIPNREIRNIFTDQILALFKEDAGRDGERLKAFCAALAEGKPQEVERLFARYLEKTVSIRDTFVKKPTKENFYHGLLLGILGYKEGWTVTSNREAGDGFSDIMIRMDEGNTGIIIEVKYAEENPEAACRRALEQIQEKGYAQGMRSEGIQTILKYGIACCRKTCRVLMERDG